jgi:hypothetical protein
MVMIDPDLMDLPSITSNYLIPFIPALLIGDGG